MLVFGERLKSARKMAGLSMRGLAELIGVSHNAINKYEHGEMNPGSDVLLQLAHALDVRPEYFLREMKVSISCPADRKHSGVGKKAQAQIEALAAMNGGVEDNN